MVHCAVIGCKSNNRKKGVRFFRFPKEKDLRKLYISKCHRPSTFDAKNARICFVHFNENDFLRDLKSELLNVTTPTTRRSLKPDAVPHLNLPGMPSTSDIKADSARDVRQNKRCQVKLVNELLKRKKIRAKACGREDLEDNVKLGKKLYGVCGDLHFGNKMFLNDLKNRLQPHAIPTVFPTSISNIADDHSYAAVSKAPDYIIKEELMDDPLDIKEEVVTESEGLIEEGFNIKNEVVSESEEMINESIDIKDEILTDSEEELVNEPLDIKDEVVSESEDEQINEPLDIKDESFSDSKEVPIEDSLDIEDEILSGSEDTLSSVSIPCTSEDTLEFEKQSLSQEVISIIKDLRSMEEIETIRRFMVSFNTVLCALRNTKENNQG